MQKRKFENLINSRGSSTSADFQVEEKERIFSVMENYGMSRGTAYNRFFRDGFRPWEVIGVSNLIYGYIKEKELSAELNNDLPRFYELLEKKSEFKEYANTLGMGVNTALTRFSGWTFKEWEIVGIKAIIDNSFITECPNYQEEEMEDVTNGTIGEI